MGVFGTESPEPTSHGYPCPHCEHRSWVSHSKLYFVVRDVPELAPLFEHHRCFNCQGVILWYDGQPVYPTAAAGPIANEDMPELVRKDFNEARKVAPISPRGAAALLRVSIDRLTLDLVSEQEGSTLDKRIGVLVARGLDPKVQRMLDVVRVIGNEAAHPGSVDFDASPELVAALFWVVNEICAEMLTKPRRLEELYDALPAPKLLGIEQRDAKAIAARATNSDAA